MSLITDPYRPSPNTFLFPELNVTVNDKDLTISDKHSSENDGNNLRSIYVLVLHLLNKDKSNKSTKIFEDIVFLVYKGAKGKYIHYQLFDAPIGNLVFEKFMGFLTTHMPYISHIKNKRLYMEKLQFHENLIMQKDILQRGWRLSFDEHDYIINSKGPNRTGACQNPYIIV